MQYIVYLDAHTASCVIYSEVIHILMIGLSIIDVKVQVNGEKYAKQCLELD